SCGSRSGSGRSRWFGWRIGERRAAQRQRKCNEECCEQRLLACGARNSAAKVVDSLGHVSKEWVAHLGISLRRSSKGSLCFANVFLMVRMGASLGSETLLATGRTPHIKRKAPRHTSA